ncbi:MAG: DNA polymerase III subunit gamma/tau [Pseudomonadota bacterium]|nr:DNA polymerase III subunit gamma/tau [Pseudomonadota bacterium]
MSYTALARKWRPRTFAEMSGQEHVLKALTNALDAGRVHHAFLFTGTRGVGKTTVARIFAKCLNCEQGISATPCGVCSTCTDIDTGRFPDLLEVDAASRTKVEDTRDLLENVQYLPARGRFKIYLIDEVHMLSTHSFNALLKTLEEPPPHVKFLLATTDPQRLPVTVLSRCLQFNLKRLPVSLIQARLAYILEQEGVAFEPAALRLIATAADGSLRDALSLLDQLLAFGGAREVREAEARTMLGTVDRSQVLQLVRLLGTQDVAQVLDYARQLEQFSPDYVQMLDALVSLLARVALYQAAGRPYDEDDDVPAETMAELAAAISPEDLQLYWQVGVLARRDLPLAGDQRSGFALALLRMLAFRPGSESSGEGSGVASGGASGGASARPASRGVAAADAGTAAVAVAPRAAASPTLDFIPANWSALIDALGLSGAARQLAANCALGGRQGNKVKLLVDARATRTAGSEAKLMDALSRYLGEKVQVVFETAAAEPPVTPARQLQRQDEERLAQARAALASDPNIQAMQRHLGATIFPDSVRPYSTEEN